MDLINSSVLTAAHEYKLTKLQFQQHEASGHRVSILIISVVPLETVDNANNGISHIILHQCCIVELKKPHSIFCPDNQCEMDVSSCATNWHHVITMVSVFLIMPEYMRQYRIVKPLIHPPIRPSIHPFIQVDCFFY